MITRILPFNIDIRKKVEYTLTLVNQVLCRCKKVKIKDSFVRPDYLCPMPVYQLRDLNQHIRETIAESYPDNLWVRAEISSISPNKSSGHCYLELSDGTARMRAMIWKSTFSELSARFERESGRKLEAGMQVQVLVKVEFSVQFSMGLVIWDLDTSYTVGEIALYKARSLERLRSEGLLSLNKNRQPGFPPFRIALITSQTAAGYEDFCKHLLENPFGYRYHLKVFPAMMQGSEAIPSLLQAFRQLEVEAEHFDYAAIIRGGGSRQDLQVFDEYPVAEALARCPIPVLSGIGHERDESLCDLVAYQQLKTPTAVADFILQLSSEAEAAVDQLINRMASTLHWAIRGREQEIELAARKIHTALSKKAVAVEGFVKDETFRIQKLGREKLHQLDLQLNALESAILSSNPLRILELGFARISQDGKRIRAKQEIAPDLPIKISMKDGEIIVKNSA